MGEVIEGRYKVVDEKPPREPVIGSWWGIPAFGLFLGANYFVRHCLLAATSHWHIHAQLSELLGR